METFIISIFIIKLIVFSTIIFQLFWIHKPKKNSSLKLNSYINNIDYRGTKKDAEIRGDNAIKKVTYSIN